MKIFPNPIHVETRSFAYFMHFGGTSTWARYDTCQIRYKRHLKQFMKDHEIKHEIVLPKLDEFDDKTVWTLNQPEPFISTSMRFPSKQGYYLSMRWIGCIDGDNIPYMEIENITDIVLLKMFL